jgi:hypothetical protein
VYRRWVVTEDAGITAPGEVEIRCRAWTRRFYADWGRSYALHLHGSPAVPDSQPPARMTCTAHWYADQAVAAHRAGLAVAATVIGLIRGRKLALEQAVGAAG